MGQLTILILKCSRCCQGIDEMKKPVRERQNRLAKLVKDGINWHIFFKIISKLKIMAKSSRGTSLDRKKVAGGQDYEVRYEKDKMDTSAEEVKKSIKKVGNQRTKVEKDLKKNKSE